MSTITIKVTHEELRAINTLCHQFIKLYNEEQSLEWKCSLATVTQLCLRFSQRLVLMKISHKLVLQYSEAYALKMVAQEGLSSNNHFYLMVANNLVTLIDKAL